MTKDDLQNLSFGEVVRSKSDGEDYVVVAFEGDTAIAVAAVNIGPQNCHDFSKPRRKP
jgi:hypothetical protein